MLYLMIVALAVPLIVAVRASVSRRGVEVNHVLLFTFGYLFYWLGPVVLGRLRLFERESVLRIWYDFYDAGSRRDSFVGFLLAILLLYSAFGLGSALGARLRLYGGWRAPAAWWFDHRLLRGYWVAGVVLTATIGWMLRAQLFTGYSAVYASEALGRGTLAALSLLLLAVLLIRMSHPEAEGLISARRLLRSPYFALYATSAVLLLSLGGRLYVVSAVIILLVYWTVYRGRIGVARAAAITVAVLAAAGAVGLVRLMGSVSALGVAANLFSEPLFTSFSLFHFLSDWQLPLLHFPRFLLGDLLNLVPTSLFPNKTEYLPNPADYGYSIFSPLGALNSFVSLMINFGLIGSAAFLFAIGTGLGVLKRQVAPVARVSYSMLSGCLAFTFFRDPFSVSIVKNMVEFSVVVPWGIVLSLHVASVAGQPARLRRVTPTRA